MSWPLTSRIALNRTVAIAIAAVIALGVIGGAGAIAALGALHQPGLSQPAMCAEDAPQAAIDPDPAIARDQRFRRATGLNADPALIRRLQSEMGGAAAESTVLYGVYLTPAESREVQLTQLLGAEISAPTVKAYTDAHADEFGGAYAGRSADTAVVFLWTGHVQEHAVALSALYPTKEGHVVARSATFPIRDLMRMQERISNDNPSLDAKGVHVTRVGVNVIRNILEISVHPADAHAMAVLRGTYRPYLWCLRDQPIGRGV